MRSTYKFALFFTGLPLVTGLLIFLLWFLQGDGELELLGFALLFVGWLLLLLGFGFLNYYRSEARQLGLDPGRIRRNTWRVVLLGLSNIPAAALVLYGVFVCKSYCAFSLENYSEDLVQDIELRIGEANISLGSLKPHQHRFRRVFLRPEGTYRVTARSAARGFDSANCTYATSSLAPQMLITFGASGSFMVEDFDEFDSGLSKHSPVENLLTAHPGWARPRPGRESVGATLQVVRRATPRV
jgi:hypothetical protein